MAQTASMPGALDTGTVNLSTGSVSFPVTLASLPGRNGLDFNLSVYYSSAEIREVVAIWTQDTPSGIMGLGWSFPQEKIVRIWNGDTQDSTYSLLTDNTLYALVRGGADAAGEIYETTSYQFWKIRYQPEYELWTITKEDGTCSFYGGCAQQIENSADVSIMDPIEWGVRWGTWTGPSNVANGQEQFPVAWNLTSIENIWGDRVAFLYEQDQQLVGTAGTARKRYTQACRLSQVIGANGESLLLHYAPEGNTENPYEIRVKEHTLPGGGPDAYQDRLEYHFLDSLKVLNANGDLMSHVRLRYASLGSGEMRKQILKSMTFSNSQGYPYEPPRLFAYYGETDADGVSVSKTDASRVGNKGALFGALKSMTTPQGATTSYQYTELAIPNARRDLDIPRPGGEWHHPLTYLGLDYAVVIWRGSGSKERRVHVSAYQWTGRWITTTLNELAVGDATDKENNIQVEIAPTFFAIVTPGQAQTVHLFHKEPLRYGQWAYTSRHVEHTDQCLVASGTSFLALLDQTNGKLSCFTRDNNQWNTPPIFDTPLKIDASGGTLFGLTACNNSLCAVSAVSNAILHTPAFQPDLALYSLDVSGNWRSLRCSCKHFFNGNVTLEKLSLVGSTTFVSLLASGIDDLDMYRSYRLGIYRWTEAKLEEEVWGEEVVIPKLSLEPLFGHEETQLAVVGDMVVVGPLDTKKIVYQYNGGGDKKGWLHGTFDNDSGHNNCLGPDSFSTTHDGQAQYWQFNPNTSQWETGNIPPYKDGNPTLWEKFWSIVWPLLSLSIGILTLPLSFGTGLLIDLALLPLDLYSLLLPSGTGGGGHNSGRFFTGDNRVYYQNVTGSWSQVGELLSDAERAEKPVSGESTTFETQDIQFQNTQAASTFIAYAITRDRKKVLKGGSSVRPAGYPTYSSKIQLLKNGAFLSSATTLPEHEALQRSPDDETNLVGWNAFLTFQGGKTLREATSLKLYRVIQDGFQGPLKDYVVSRVSVHDGYEEVHTHYEYEAASAECLPMGTTALYNKVTTLYSGTSTTSTRGNGYTESYFYVGDTASLPNQPADQTSTNSADYPALLAGRSYATHIYDGDGRRVAATTRYWRVFQRALLGNHGNGYYLHQVKESRELDGGISIVEETYTHRDDLGNCFPDKRIVSNYDVTGHEEKHETEYRYGFEIYRELRDRHILAPVVQSITRVNGIETSNQATTWLPALRNLFRLTPGRELSAQFQGTEWSATDINSVSVNVVCPFPLGYASTRWEPDIPTLTLLPPFSGRLLFTYDCDVTVDGGWGWAELEVLVDGSKVWGISKTNAHISEAIAIDLSRSNQRVEWRVTNCGVEVKREETGHHSNHGARVVVSVRDIRMQDLQLLAPAATYQAKKPQGLTRPEDASLAWLKTSTVVVRNATYGLVTETQDVDSITSSNIYDTNYQFPVAHFVHASVEKHEAGYYGFEDYEDSALWQLTGASDEEGSAYSGQKAYTGRSVRIEPRTFTPRSAATLYIVSAWVKPRSEGSGGQIGFGNTVKQIASNNDDWQYVEFVTYTPLADQKPFASCDGAIDDFRFGPVDAPFSATVYDPTYHLVTAQLGTNGETIRSIYDDCQTLIALTGPDGKEISYLMTETHSREDVKPFDSVKPNQKLSLLPRNGGRHYHTLADYQGYKEIHRRYAGDPQVFVEQRVTPATANYGFKLRVSASKNTLNPTFFGFQFGDRVVLSDAPHRILLHQTMPMYASYDHPIKSFTPEHDPLDGSEWLLIVLERRAFFFLEGQFLFSETFTEQFVRLSTFWGPEESRVSCGDVFLFSDPIVALEYTDGLDRVIQTVHLDQHGQGTVASQILYDGWGHPAVTTKPLHSPETVTSSLSLTYQQDVVKTFDWQSGLMTGKVVDYYREAILDYYRGASSFVNDLKLDDGQYPYSYQIAEASPLARISQITQPGIDFKAGSPLAVRIDYSRTPEANALLADLGLADKAGSYTARTTRHPFDGHTRSVTTQLFNLKGSLVALRHGQGKTAQTSTRRVTYASDGTRTVTSTQPNAFSPQGTLANNQYSTATTLDFPDHPQASTDSDRGTEQYIYDGAGRLRFKLDAVGAAQNPHQILYWKYDALGRILEEGILRQQWNREQLQHSADVSSPGEAPGSVMEATATRWYAYDIFANTTTTNLKGRLCEVRTRDEDGREVRESFAYDLAGNLISAELFVPAFGTRDSVTRYEYDRHGNVTRIIYPYDLAGQPGFEVHYFYNINGQLASIGTTDDPSRYAAYEYDLEGRVKTEHLNSRRLQRDHNYTLQGRLLSLKDGLFVEELRYRDASGNFKDGYVVGATITGAADWSRGHSYSYQYDEYGRLTAAQTVTAGYAIVPHPTWNVQGPDGHIEYDANGNLLHMNQGQISTTYQYTQETNKLKSLLRDVPDRRSFGFEASELAHFHTNSEPQIFGDWYAKGVEGGITAEEKHSGTQSYQLGQNVLLSKIQVTPESKAYLCSGWLKMQGPNQEVGIQIKASLNGPVLSEQRVPFTDDLWQAFQCVLPDAGDATELFVVILQTRRTQPPLPVYIDDVTFGLLEQDVYEHNQNGWITKNGKLDSLRYDPHTALPVDIRSGNRSTHFRYGGRGRRVLKTTVDNEQDLLLEQRLYIHGANAYPLTEITSDGETIYIYGHGGVVAVCENGQTPSFLLKDHLGSTRVVMDQKNQPIATFHYLPFGSLLPDSGNSQEAIKRFRYLYTGQEYDEEIGLYNYRARLYDSDLGRFLTPDPKRQFPSPYVYVNNNPLNFTDPTGEMLLRLLRRDAPRAIRGMGARRLTMISDPKDLKKLFAQTKEYYRRDGDPLFFGGNKFNIRRIQSSSGLPIVENAEPASIRGYMHENVDNGAASFTRSIGAAVRYGQPEYGLFVMKDPQLLPALQRHELAKITMNLQQEVQLFNVKFAHLDIQVTGEAYEKLLALLKKVSKGKKTPQMLAEMERLFLEGE